MVLWIAQKLLAEGKSVGILTRGYRGQPIPVSAGDEIGTAEEIKITNSSDEVQMLAARLGDRVRFGVGANRFENGSQLAAQGVNWFVLDDGFQHWHLERNVDLVLIDAMTPFGGGQLLPAGRLREPLTALARADIVVITRTESSPGVETTIRQYSSAPIFYAQPQLDSIRKIEAGRLAGPVSSGAADRLFVFCAIGNPNGFIQTLSQSGVTISGPASGWLVSWVLASGGAVATLPPQADHPSSAEPRTSERASGARRSMPPSRKRFDESILAC